MTKAEFIKQIAKYVQKYAPQYGIECNSAVIAQAILESGWGESRLSKQYHNYFGLKCGTLWKGASVNMATQEEYSPGQLTNITDNFRAYASMEDGVKGYFEFIQLARYRNLKGITDPQKYLETIRADGYATSYSYVQNCMNLVTQYKLTKYDTVVIGKPETETIVIDPGTTAQDVVNLAQAYIGCNEADGSHRQIIDGYNAHKPWARNHMMSYTEPWCDTFVSFIFIRLNAVDLIGGTECGVEWHVKLFQKAGIWNEDGTIVPQPGDIIVFNWDDNTQPNDGYSDHIGIVESVGGGKIVTIEGNYSDAVKRRVLSVGDGNIRGYARPKYGKASVAHEKTTQTAQTVNSTTKPVEVVVEASGTPNKVPRWVGRVTADILNVRSWAGIENTNIKSYPVLKYGNLVDVCDTVKDSNGADWYYVRIAGQFYGFVSAQYVTRN